MKGGWGEVVVNLDNFLNCLYFDTNNDYKAPIRKSCPNWLIKPQMYVMRSTIDGKLYFNCQIWRKEN